MLSAAMLSGFTAVATPPTTKFWMCGFLPPRIATASAAVQEKVLRIIEYGEFERVGGREEVAVDVRVVGATNVDLPSLARAGRFRPDLLDRLAFEVVTVPPLRARPADIDSLAEQFGLDMAIA